MADIQINCTVISFDGNPPWLEIETTGRRYQAGMESPSRAIFLVPVGAEPPHGWYLEYGGKRERQPDPFYTEAGAYEGPVLDYGSSAIPVPPDPVPPDETLEPSATPDDPQVQINCTVVDFDGNAPILEIETNGHRYGAGMESPERAIFRVPGGVEPAHGWYLNYSGKHERQPDPFYTTLGSYEGPVLHYAPIHVIPPPLEGVTQTVGRAWTRSGTPFYPLYYTLFWALGGWMRGDRGRVEQHFQWLAGKSNGFRMLAQVNWSGEEIDPDKPGYEQAFGEMLDVAYDQYGLLAKITLIGGGARSPGDLATKVRNVVAPRRNKVLLLEGVNEQNASQDDAKQMLDILRDLNLPMAAGFGNTGVDGIKDASQHCHDSACCMHTERSGNDDRKLRQVWDLKEFNPLPADDGEGPGPGASTGGELHDAVVLAAKRAGAAAGGGAGAFCLHTGAGVFGRARPAGAGREACPANIWETGNIEEIAERVRRACEPFEPGMENWSRYNTGMPVRVVEGPFEKHYGGRGQGHFGQIVTGTRNPDGSPAGRIVMAGNAPYKVYAPGGDVLAESNGGRVEVGGYVAYVVSGVDGGPVASGASAEPMDEPEPKKAPKPEQHEY